MDVARRTEGTGSEQSTKLDNLVVSRTLFVKRGNQNLLTIIKNNDAHQNNTNTLGYLQNLRLLLSATASSQAHLLSERRVPVSIELSTRGARPAALPLSRSCGLLLLSPPKLNQPPDFLAPVFAVGAG